MLLAIDAGNTNIVFALFKADETCGVWRIATQAQRTSDEYAVFLHALMAASKLDPNEINAAILGSVVPEANFSLTRLCRDHFRCEPMIVGAPDVQLGLEVLLDRPEEVGADRVINAIGGLSLYKPPFFIIDFGTATTFDVVDEKGRYVGGAIAPGINLSLQALHMAAAKLPRIAISRPRRVIGKNTVEAIQSGIFWGYVGLIEGMISRLKGEFSASVKVIATGGLAKLFIDVVKGIDQFDDDITLRGLRLIYERNHKRKIS